MMRRAVLWMLLVAWTFPFNGRSADTFNSLRDRFVKGYAQLGMPPVAYDYRGYLTHIPSIESLQRQRAFFETQRRLFASLPVISLAPADRIDYRHISYEIEFNLSRLALEENWVRSGRPVPEAGISTLPRHKEWYASFIQRFTSTGFTPEQVYALGVSEVRRVKSEIERIRRSLGFPDERSFYQHLAHDSFYLTDKQSVIRGFEAIDRNVRKHLADFISIDSLPEVYAIEWNEAGPNTPPGAYLNHTDNAYGKDVFQFNFYRQRYNRRAMEWLYMHEAIPGHHLQASLRHQQPQNAMCDLFLYPGNFEGWACYVEYHGKELGLHKNVYAELGKWEWDLVRSARLVLDAGIHYYGWSKEKALQYWKETIPGQNDIAEREVNRVTYWCGQALSYKVGAYVISEMQEQWVQAHQSGDVRAFRDAYLRMGMRPLSVIRQSIIP
jgi:uncharacterized protein (DUF885 family)